MGWHTNGNNLVAPLSRSHTKNRKQIYSRKISTSLRYSVERTLPISFRFVALFAPITNPCTFILLGINLSDSISLSVFRIVLSAITRCHGGDSFCILARTGFCSRAVLRIWNHFGSPTGFLLECRSVLIVFVVVMCNERKGVEGSFGWNAIFQFYVPTWKKRDGACGIGEAKNRILHGSGKQEFTMEKIPAITEMRWLKNKFK